MFSLQALQANGSWHTLSIHPTAQSAQVELCRHGSFKFRTVSYRIIKS